MLTRGDTWHIEGIPGDDKGQSGILTGDTRYPHLNLVFLLSYAKNNTYIAIKHALINKQMHPDPTTKNR